MNYPKLITGYIHSILSINDWTIRDEAGNELQATDIIDFCDLQFPEMIDAYNDRDHNGMVWLLGKVCDEFSFTMTRENG